MISRPGWATAIGIMMILFGGCGAVNHLKMTKTNQIDEMTNAIVRDIDVKVKTDKADSLTNEEYIEGDSLTTNPEDSVFDVKKTILEMTYMTDYFKRWSVITGYIGLGLALLYLAGGIMLFYDKRITIPIVYAALLLSLLFAAFKIYIFNGDESSSLILSAMNATFYISILIDVVLLLIVKVSDKEFYLGQDMFDGS